MAASAQQTTPPAAPSQAAAKRRRVVDALLAFARRPEAGVVPVAIAVFIIFSASSSVFLTQDVWGAILTITAELGVIALFVTLLMIAGDFDLSVGSVFGLSAAMVPFLASHGWGVWPAVIVTLAMCAAIGLANAYLVVHLQLPSLIVTIGGLMFYAGIALHLTSGLTISLTAEQADALSVFNSSVHGITVSAFWFIGIGIVLAIVLGRTALGNWIFAVGGNRAAARTAGVKVATVRTGLFVATSMSAGLGGIFQVARLTSVDALRGTGYELQAILAVIVGGTSLFGGAGGVIGTMLGVLILGMAQMGLILVGVPAYWYQTGVGLFLILAVATNETFRRRMRGR